MTHYRQVGFFDPTFAVDVNVPANGQSATLTIPDVVHMDGAAPPSCADQVLEFPVNSITANRV